MLALRTILGGIWALCLTGTLLAAPGDLPDSPHPQAFVSSMSFVAPPALLPSRPAWRPGLRPLSRAEGARVALAGFRPLARPLAMVRYPVVVRSGASLRPEARRDLPETVWTGRSDGDVWTRAVLSAINGQSHDLSDIVPADIGQWCPAYADNSEHLRDSFWVGMMSALARYESRLDPRAVGGGGLWYGLLQIYPPTARHFGCEATTGEALMNPTANLACAARIMTVTVRRDQAVALHDGRWQGVAADWGPMTEGDKRAAMMEWTRAQDYCVIRDPHLRPRARPAGLVAEADPPRPRARPVPAGLPI